ncbi:MAG: glycoside hydrolase family 3 N-terminal domain-containing protein [Chloroflexota bacterium]
MRNRHRTRLLLAVLVLLLCIPLAQGQAASPVQSSSPEARAQDTLELMTPEERVGQLFLVTFQGTQVGPETQIYDLIINHHVGGVVLWAENDNFTASDQNLNDLWTLTNQLQTFEFSSAQDTQPITDTQDIPNPTYVPLFIGIAQGGDGYPNDQILNGLTPLPSQLAIGATWNTDLARQVGAVSGGELSALGINLLFGPSLDVLENPHLEGASGLGVRAFGGDPFWVGEMGRAYIAGLHEGSEGRMAVAGTHFPGLGSSDRLPEDEVATVRKSLEQLKQIELAPFFSVTGDANSDAEKVDALLTSHIRYQGLQGNIRSTTRPVGFDQQALSLLMELPPFASWREDGGVMISDDLGSRAVRRFYDPTEQEFNARRLALDAFLAGNDLLYLNNFIESDDPDSYTTILRALDFFIQKYREDQSFAERVDASVLRILDLKFRLYGFFTLDIVLPSGNLDDVGTSEQVTFAVAQQGATLISPSIGELDNVLPDTPARNDRIVFITDDYTVQQCTECPEQSVLPADTLKQAVIRLYGPEAGGQVLQYYLNSYTFAQLEAMLEHQIGSRAIENDLHNARWIVFTMLDVSEKRPSSQALLRFLSERPDLTSDKRIIVFAANAPNYLDATDISKLTAYFGLFSKATPFMDVAARLLFKEIAIPLGSLPVSVPGVGYDLISATSPNPELRIHLNLEIPELDNLGDAVHSEDLLLPEYHIGDTIPLKTGLIFDHNGHPVPNNTPVQFIIIINGEETPPISMTTIDGFAQAEYVVAQSGKLVIQVISGLAQSESLTLEIPFEEATPVPTITVTPTDAPTAIPLSATPTLTPEPEPVDEEPRAGLDNWLGALAIVAIVGWGASRTGALMGQVSWGIRWGLSAIVGGLLFYTYVALDLPGSLWLLDAVGHWGLLLAALVGAVLGWGVALSVYAIGDWRLGIGD